MAAQFFFFGINQVFSFDYLTIICLSSCQPDSKNANTPALAISSSSS
jgi:hypothetical protein